MIPVPATDDQAAFWSRRDGGPVVSLTIGGPEEGDGVIPCPALVQFDERGTHIVHVAYQLDEIEVAKLAHGGTLWLTTFGMIPVHLCEVISRDEVADA